MSHHGRRGAARGATANLGSSRCVTSSEATASPAIGTSENGSEPRANVDSVKAPTPLASAGGQCVRTAVRAYAREKMACETVPPMMPTAAVEAKARL